MYDAMGFFKLSLLALIFAVDTSATAQVQSSVECPKLTIDVVELGGHPFA